MADPALDRRRSAGLKPARACAKGTMMARWLKEGISEAAADEADAGVRATVAGIIDEVKRRGDAGVRDLSERFDHWSPVSFRLSQQEIEECVASLGRQVIDDIGFAQAQIRRFAEI